jgi:Tfp pilus assembly protein FimT
MLLSQAVPAMQQLKQKRRMQGIAQTLMTDLQQARSEAVRRGDSAIQFRFSRHAAGSCYVGHIGKSGECLCNEQGQAVCQDPATLLKAQWVPASHAATIRANVKNLSFQARQGAVTSAGSIEITGQDGRGIRHVVSAIGRVRSCSPDGGFGQMPCCLA